MSELLELLTGGDRRSIGRSNEVVERVLAEPSRFVEVIEGLDVDDALLRMRCADAAEKISAVHPEWLDQHKKKLMALATRSTEKEMRWHLAQMLPRLKLDAGEKRAATDTLFDYLQDRSRIVQTFALQALSDFAENDAALSERLLPLLKRLRQNGAPAVQSRARKLIAKMCGTKSRPSG